ncbi:MAG: STAS domain-containing protein [bacterium]
MILREDLDTSTTIIRPDGHIDKEEYDHLATVFDRLEREGRTHILLDLSHVRFLDRRSIIQLLRHNRKVLSQGGALKLLRPTPEAQASLRSAQVIHLFESYRLQGEAIRSFRMPGSGSKNASTPLVLTEEERLRREALMQMSTISMLITMLEDKNAMQTGEMDARWVIEAENIFSALRQRMFRGEADR